MKKQGTVKRWLPERGFGFLTGWDGDVFCHVSDVSDKTDLVPGESVSYDVADSPRGPRAVNVRRILDGLDRLDPPKRAA